MGESAPHADSELKPPTALAIRTIRCPRCFHTFERNCEGLETPVSCPSCETQFPYLDGYLIYYREYIELFIDPVHSIPLVPGYSINGRVMSLPDDLLIVDFGLTYRRPPDVFFLIGGDRTARQWIRGNQVLMPLSTSEENFILFSRSIDRNQSAEPVAVHWMALGETGDWEKPLWLNYLQNAAGLVRQEEDVAAVVMLTMALDFFYDAVLARRGITFPQIRRRGRKKGMNEKRAKLEYLREELGDWPANFELTLGDLTDYRNRVVHGIVKDPPPPDFSGRKAFQVVMRAVMFLIEMMHRATPDPGARTPSTD